MRCEDLDELLDAHNAQVSAVEQQGVDEHLAACDRCRGAWRTAQALRAHHALPMAVPSAVQLAKFLAARPPSVAPRRMSPWVAAIGGALAAGVALVAVDYFRTAAIERAPVLPALTMSLNETRDVSVTIDSPEAFMDVEVRVLLAGGIELEGRAGRRELKWTTDLERGVNRLTLPIFAADSTGGRILVAVGRGEQQRAFVVQIDVADGAAADTEI